MASSELDYKRYLNLIVKHKKMFLIASLAIMTIITFASYLLPAKYEAKSTVFIEKSVIGELVKGLAITPSVDDKIKVLTYALSSRTLITKVIDELDLNTKKSGEAYVESLIAKLQKNTVIKIKDKEGLFIISFQDSDPKLARDYVNTLVRRYIEENVSTKRQDSYGATKFISEQMGTFKEKLTKAEDAVNSYKRGEGSVAAMDPGLLLKEINDAQQRMDDNRIKQSYLETQISSMSKTESSADMHALRSRLEELQRQYTDNYPGIIKLKEEIAAMQAQGGKSRNTSPEYLRLSSELKALRQSEANLRGIIGNNRRLLMTIPAAKAKLENLEREMHAQKQLYEQLVAREGQSEVSKQMEVQDKSTVFRIVDPAVLPVQPVSPDRVKLILLAILAGLAGGAGLVFARDVMNPAVKDVDTLKSLGIRVLAIIPRMEDPQQLIAQTRQNKKLYLASGTYFMLILCVLVFEILKKVGIV